MDAIVNEACSHILTALAAQHRNDKLQRHPFLVAIAAVPGAGKTVFAAAVSERLNELAKNHFLIKSTTENRKVDGQRTLASTENLLIAGSSWMPMDGYHLTRAQLSAMPNAKEAHDRRGAHFTFDPDRLNADLLQLREEGSLAAPAFDHAVKDPEPGKIQINAPTQVIELLPNEDECDPHAVLEETVTYKRHVVIVEGLYLCLSTIPVWNRLNSTCFDLRLFVKADMEEATERLILRHMNAWGITREMAESRARGSDRLNAELVDGDCRNADFQLTSVSDETFAKIMESKLSHH